MTDDLRTLLDQIERDFRFLADDFAFAAMPSQRSGDTITVQYQHPQAVIQFTLRGGEWQALAWPAAPQMQSNQVKLDDVVTYLTRPPIDFAADQARPSLTQSQALSELAQQLAPVAGEMLDLFEAARWPAVWADMQAALHARSAARSHQFAQWWQSRQNG